MSKPHRGRIQAQGEGLEKSVSWSQDEPLSKADGLQLVDKLAEKLSDKEYDTRKKELDKARRFIDNTQGGLDAVKKKSFLKLGSKDIRIDIEILAGTAFLSALLILIVWYLLD